MATDAEQLAIIKSGILAKLAELAVEHKPSYNIDGQDIEWTEYQEMLMKQLKDVNAQINSESPFEIHSQGFSS